MVPEKPQKPEVLMLFDVVSTRGSRDCLRVLRGAGYNFLQNHRGGSKDEKNKEKSVKRCSYKSDWQGKNKPLIKFFTASSGNSGSARELLKGTEENYF